MHPRSSYPLVVPCILEHHQKLYFLAEICSWLLNCGLRVPFYKNEENRIIPPIPPGSALYWLGPPIDRMHRVRVRWPQCHPPGPYIFHLTSPHVSTYCSACLPRHRISAVIKDDQGSFGGSKAPHPQRQVRGNPVGVCCIGQKPASKVRTGNLARLLE